MHPTAVATALVAAVGCAVLVSATDGLRAFTSEGARRLTVSEHPRALPDPELTNFKSRPFRLIQNDQRVTIVEFIYTRCPTICSALGDAFAKLMLRFDKDGLGDRVRLISISFDPQDQDAELTEYATSHGADGGRWVTARASKSADLPGLLNAFGVVVLPDGEGGFVHNAAIHVLDREGRLAMIYDLGDEEHIAINVRRMLQ